jgi:hypothetical protein
MFARLFPLEYGTNGESNMKKLTLALWTAIGALALTLLTGQAYAQINSPVPSNAYIVFDGLDWAWGGPCEYSGGCGDGNLTYQSTQGWGLPSAADLAIIDALDGSVAGGPGSDTFANLFYGNSGNVPLGGTDPVSGAFFSGENVAGSCATPYFSGAGQTWCDNSDGSSGYWAGSAISTLSGANGASEQLYVRSAIPEPSTWVMMLTGFAGLSFAALRWGRNTSAVIA